MSSPGSSAVLQITRLICRQTMLFFSRANNATLEFNLSECWCSSDDAQALATLSNSLPSNCSNALESGSPTHLLLEASPYCLRHPYRDFIRALQQRPRNAQQRTMESSPVICTCSPFLICTSPCHTAVIQLSSFLSQTATEEQTKVSFQQIPGLEEIAHGQDVE